jgi:hypothetical protein
MARTPLFQKVTAGIGSIRTLLNRTPESPPLADVKSLHDEARNVNLAIAAAD